MKASVPEIGAAWDREHLPPVLGKTVPIKGVDVLLRNVCPRSQIGGEKAIRQQTDTDLKVCKGEGLRAVGSGVPRLSNRRPASRALSRKRCTRFVVLHDSPDAKHQERLCWGETLR